MSGSFSWTTLGFFVGYFVILYILISHIKENHGNIYDSFGGKRVWFSALEQLKFFGFLFGLRYIKLQDNKLTLLAVSTKFILIIATYFIFTQPIYYDVRI
jgi:hypothetical protein